MRLHAGHDPAGGRRDRQRRLPRRRPHRQLDLRGARPLPPGGPVARARRGPRGAAQRRRCAPARARNGVVGMGITPDSIIELWIQTLAKHGIESLWIFDCLHDVDQMLNAAADREGGRRGAGAADQLRHSPVHTDEYYADLMDRFAASDVPTTIILGDEAGVLSPERARPWIRLMRERAQGKRRSSCTSTTAPGWRTYNHIIGVEEGVDDPPHGRDLRGQRRLHALHRGQRGQHAPPRPRAGDRRQPARRGRRAPRGRSPTTRATRTARRPSTRWPRSSSSSRAA